MTSDTIPEIVSVTALAALVVREVFAFLKSKSTTTPAGFESVGAAIQAELEKMNNNHLHSIEGAITKGNEHLVDIIHADNSQMIEILGEIKGKL